jgi:hypothetical protein
MNIRKEIIIILCLGLLVIFSPSFERNEHRQKTSLKITKSENLEFTLGYIPFHITNYTMKLFYEFLNESRNYDNQGHGVSTVKKIQAVLVKLGVLPPKLNNGKDSIDGKFGQATTSAMSKFQVESGLLDTKGHINKETLDKMGIDTLVFGVIEQLNEPKVNSENLQGLGNFTSSMYEGAPLIIVYGGINVKERESGDYMYDYFNGTGNNYNLFVAKNHHINGLEAYNKVIQHLQGQNIYPRKKALYLFSGGVRPGFQLLQSVSPNEFEKIYLVDIYIGKNTAVYDLYTQLAKNYPNKVEFYYTGSDSEAGGLVNLKAKREIKASVSVSKQGSNHMLTNVDAVSSLMSYFKN